MKKFITIFLVCLICLPCNIINATDISKSIDSDIMLENALFEENFSELCKDIYSSSENSIESFQSYTLSEIESPYGLTVNDIQSLTATDFELISDTISSPENKNLTEAERNNLAAEMIKNLSKDSQMMRGPSGSFNSVELALALLYPGEGAIYFNICYEADLSADSKYTQNSCWYDGNGDAYRHILWSSTLYISFYTVNNSSHQIARARTLVWTNAHEGYAPTETPPSAFDTWLSVIIRMDLYNNLIGMALAETRIIMNSYGWTTMTQRAEAYTDDGTGRRIELIDGRRLLVPTSNSEKL